MKNLILLLVMVTGLDYMSKSDNSVSTVTSTSSDDRYYEELAQKKMHRALVVKAKYSSTMIVSNK